MKAILRAIVVWAAFGPRLSAQTDVGIAGGIPLTDFILDNRGGGRTGFSMVTSAPRRYTVGPFVEFRVRGPISVEAGALYKRFGFDSASSGGIPAGPLFSANSFTTGNSLEFPILAKAHLRLFPKANAYVSAGPSIRRLFAITETGQRAERPLFPPGADQVIEYRTGSPEGMNRRTSIGAAVGAGLAFRAGPLRISPGFRLTRWDTERTSSMPATSRLARTQAEALLSVAGVIGDEREPPPGRIPCCFEAGILAGAPLLRAYDVLLPQSEILTTIDAPTRRFAAGAFLDWRFHRQLSLEGSFLARRFGHAETTYFPGTTFRASLAGYSWEVPLLLKWRTARVRSATLVIGGGAALRRASSAGFLFTSGGTSSSADASFITSRSALGPAVSGGVEFRAGTLRLRPELRYVRFERPLYDFYTVTARQDSLHLLLGVSWAAVRR
ncbi:MAG: PorT family protein [Bryobacteraceae bacterium]|nr:PorT family protein [Bryobacteraceae bacterium]